MTKVTKRRIGIACLLLLAAAAVFSLGYIRPAIPAEWKEIAVGMTRDEALSHVSNELYDMWELKGFDIATREYTQWGFRRCWWHLQLTYEDAGLVKSVETIFTDPNCGLFNTGWQTVN